MIDIGATNIIAAHARHTCLIILCGFKTKTYWYTKHLQKNILIDTTINNWTNPRKIHFDTIKLGTDKTPRYIHANPHAPWHIRRDSINVFQKYWDVFAWTLENLKGILPHILEQKLDLISTLQWSLKCNQTIQLQWKRSWISS